VILSAPCYAVITQQGAIVLSDEDTKPYDPTLRYLFTFINEKLTNMPFN